MAVTVYDESGQLYNLGTIYETAMEQPLVHERRDVLSYPFGNAELVQIAFTGVYIVYGDLRMYKRHLLHFDMSGEPELIELHFTLSGTGSMLDLATGNLYSYSANEHNMHYAPNFTGQCDYSANEQYKFFEVHFTPAYFCELAKDSSPKLMAFAERIQQHKSAILSRRNQILHSRCTNAYRRS